MSAPVISGAAETKVQETADDAAVSKLSAVRLGYVNDPFLCAFVRKTSRRSPLINRGYFARMAALEQILRRFVAASKRTGDGTSQIVSLGAGLDTSFFRLWNDNSASTVYFEVDFPEITSRKLAIIRKHNVLMQAVAGHPLRAADVEALEKECSTAPAAAHGHGHAHAHGPAHGHAYGPAATSTSPAPGATASAAPAVPVPAGVTVGTSALGGGELHSSVYHLLTADLRDVASLQAALSSAGIVWTRPTLFLSECVLVYLEPEESCAIIAWAARALPRSVFVTYEQIRPHDAFGQVMARNLEERGYSLRGLNAFPDIQAQIARYRELGYGACTACDMNDVYYRLLPHSDVARVERLELFDEVEEWHLMSAHYCIAVAVNETPDVPQRHATGKHAPGTDSPARSIITDMPAPAPKMPRGAHAALSPKELAAAVVHAHEDPMSSARSTSTSPSPSPLIPPARSAARSRSRSGTGADSDLDAVAHAVSSAAGTTVESMNVDMSPSPSVSSGDQGLIRATSSASVGSTGGLVGTIRTHAGDIVLGGAHVDFEAIAEAEEEMTNARHIREAAGIDVIRDTDSSAKTATGASAVPPPGLRSPTSALHAAAVENSKAGMVASTTRTTYDAASLLAAERYVSLSDVLFPVEQWKKATVPAHGSRAAAPGSARRE